MFDVVALTVASALESHRQDQKYLETLSPEDREALLAKRKAEQRERLELEALHRIANPPQREPDTGWGSAFIWGLIIGGGSNG